jgi:hypothetical protein
MGYILKNTSGLVNTKITDTGRKKLSEGNFKISYFQVGDSEVSYDTLSGTNYNQMDTNILEPEFNAQNSVGGRESNKHNVKYPYIVDVDSTNTYGIPFMASEPQSVFNTAVMRGFFTGDTSSENISWSALTNNNYVINSNYIIDMSVSNCTDTIDLILNECNVNPVREPHVGDLVTIFWDGGAKYDCSCEYFGPTPTPTPSPTNECWSSGFTVSEAIGSGNTSYIFINTLSTKNGKPIFISTFFPVIIYYNGVRWILADENLEYLGPIGDNPIGTYTLEDNVEYISFCENKSFCLTLNSDVININVNLSFYDDSEPIIYTVEPYFQISFSADSNSWVVITEEGVIAYLPDVLSGDTPIGSWTITELGTGIDLLETNLGICQDFPFSCTCVSITATSENTVISYLDCDFDLKTETFINNGDVGEFCMINPIVLILVNEPFYFTLSGSSQSSYNCTGSTCTPVTLNNYQVDPCASPTPTPTPSATFCPTPTPSRACPPIPDPNCTVSFSSCYQMMTYRIVKVCQNTITLDRPTPNFACSTGGCYARALVYPPSMTTLYDSITPRPHWNDDVIDFESVCGIDAFNVNVWNMNIPWSESPAGLFDNLYKDYTTFASKTYLGTKEYLGYASTGGQTFYNPNTSTTATTDTFYYNSLGDKIFVSPNEQKTIAVLHYTNQTIDFFYGEKFALEPYNESNPGETGQARNFKLHIPWLMWHKNTNCCNGVTFWVDPPGFEDLETSLFQVHYIYSSKNPDMNTPGIRYYHLWDTFANPDGYPNRVGKVFPDHKIIVIDDEEIVAAMSYKSNRNWTLPSPRVGLVTPNTCGNDNNSLDGILSGNSQYLHITYRLSNTDCLDSNSLHSNYYTVIQGPNLNCNTIQPQNVSVRFGSEFPCLNTCYPVTTTTTTSSTPCWLSGFQMSLQCISGSCSGDVGFEVVYHIDVYPTNNYINGYPIYFNPIIISNVYFDGNNWIITGIGEENFILSSSSPLGSTILSGDSLIQITTECRESKQICYNFCDNETCDLGVGIEVNLSGDTFYIIGGDILITYSSDTSNWVLLSNDIVIATLSGLTSTETPIGNWNVVQTGITTFVTTQSTVDCYYDLCNCLSLTVTGLNPSDSDVTLKYMDCFGILNSTPVQSGETISQCIMGDAYDYVTTATTINFSNEVCELICPPLTTFYNSYSLTTTTTTCPPVCLNPTGFFANKLEIICQLVDGNGRPNPSEWKIIDFTDQLLPYLVSGQITQEAITSTTFVITPQDYDNAPSYDLNDYIPLVSANYTGTSLNFGDEYYFYGALETDIMATIYEMRYKINLGQSEFQLSSNPSWKNGNPSYITEIGLYDDQKNLMIISKLQSPVLRQGIQQFLVKFDF